MPGRRSNPVGVASLIACQLGGWPAWSLATFAGAAVYLLLVALEIAAGRGVHQVAGTSDLEGR